MIFSLTRQGETDMTGILTAIVGAVLLAAVLTALPELVRDVEARAPEPIAKGDRLDARDSDGCGQAWPYYEPHCLRDRSQPDARLRSVRAISLDGVRR
jgi:hypothetical protein